MILNTIKPSPVIPFLFTPVQILIVLESGEVAMGLRELAALTEESVLILSSHMVAHNWSPKFSQAHTYM